jgi:hypothetical protein
VRGPRRFGKEKRREIAPFQEGGGVMCLRYRRGRQGPDTSFE